ncbi:DNA ligase [Mycobacterium sp. 663a-19]|uniref:DNA polymerase ligase N-terminal domain-containing protein n=1 Tax=Mycobacterium sp. 663a-19 TaxID=2986148 RepID=UPI002D1F8B72|nr:DNA polymerase ligase N-terminal domain-containing protein [Mycobacterium sp. 663a-19]MEB3981884.1 DNA ligase [Mycobacterium sp. 663a-19]
MPLSEYRRKRRSGRSPEPRGERGRKRGKAAPSGDGPIFVIQHHAARSDHYDFRLEIDGVLVSWAIPKGPSTNPKDRRMARRTEDHPLEYSDFEGVIPEGEYGAGGVIVWDRGTYDNATQHDMSECLERGHLSFRLHGEKLEGGFALTRIREGKDETWLLVKRRDEDADARRKPVKSQPESVLTGRTLDDLDESS